MRSRGQRVGGFHELRKKSGPLETIPDRGHFITTYGAGREGHWLKS